MYLARVPMATVVAVSAIFGAAVLTGKPGIAQDLDMNEIFRCYPTEEVPEERCDEGRKLVLDNCTLCHIFVPIVMVQFDRQGWQGLIDRHREGGRADQLSDEQVETVTEYLAANFNPDYDPPELPAALLENWTAY